MIFRKNNKLKFGKKYFVNNIKCEPLYYSKDKEVLMLREYDGNLSFIFGDFKVQNDKIVCTNKVSYTISEKEMLDCINSNLAEDKSVVTVERVVNAIQNKYYKIPTTIARVIAEYYTM